LKEIVIKGSATHFTNLFDIGSWHFREFLRANFVLGVNKITPDLASAIYRARNVAAPLNSKKNKKSSLNPCATLDEKCYDCGSPDRICNALTIYYKKMRNMQTMEIIIINESLGF